jgi:hypothetical protein
VSGGQLFRAAGRLNYFGSTDSIKGRSWPETDGTASDEVRKIDCLFFASHFECAPLAIAVVACISSGPSFLTELTRVLTG